MSTEEQADVQQLRDELARYRDLIENPFDPGSLWFITVTKTDQQVSSFSAPRLSSWQCLHLGIVGELIQTLLQKGPKRDRISWLEAIDNDEDDLVDQKAIQVRLKSSKRIHDAMKAELEQMKQEVDASNAKRAAMHRRWT